MIHLNRLKLIAHKEENLKAHFINWEISSKHRNSLQDRLKCHLKGILLKSQFAHESCVLVHKWLKRARGIGEAAKNRIRKQRI